MKNRTDTDFSKHILTIIETDHSTTYTLKEPGTVFYSTSFINTCGIMAVTGDFGNWIFCRPFEPKSDLNVGDGYMAEKLKINSNQDPYRFSPEATKNHIKEQYLNENKRIYDTLMAFMKANHEMFINEDYDELFDYFTDKKDLESYFNVIDGLKDLKFITLYDDLPVESVDCLLDLIDYDEFLSQEEYEYLANLIENVDHELDYNFAAYRYSEPCGRFEDYENIPFIKEYDYAFLAVLDSLEYIGKLIEENDPNRVIRK